MLKFLYMKDETTGVFEMEAGDDIQSIIGPDGEIIYVHPAYEKELGMLAQEAIRKAKT